MEPKQQKMALVKESPLESGVSFQGKEGKFAGVPVKELPEEQRKAVQKLLATLIEPFRKDDQDEALACMQKQGGLDKCYLSFYKEGALAEGEWDNWRLEGPSFVWYFRGTPHVHVWANIAADPAVKLNA